MTVEYNPELNDIGFKPPLIIKAYVAYREFIKNTLLPSTVERYTNVMDNFLHRYDNRYLITVNHFHRWDFEDYFAARAAEGVALGTIRLEKFALKSWWNWMLDHGYAMRNPIPQYKRKSRPFESHITCVRRQMTREHIDLLYSHARTPREKLVVLLPLTTGSRAGDMAELRWEDILWDENLIMLRRNRVRIMSKDVKEQLLLLRDGVYFSRGDPALVFRSNSIGVQESYWKLATRAGFLDRNISTLRHTYNMHVMRSNIERWVIPTLLGEYAQDISKEIFLDTRLKLERYSPSA